VDAVSSPRLDLGILVRFGVLKVNNNVDFKSIEFSEVANH
jgi:hypothetical protein